MKLHYLVERYRPSYEIEAIFGGPALVRKEECYCRSSSYWRTKNIKHVTCKACLKKLGIDKNYID